MKKLLILMLFGMIATGAHAQWFGEWFQQKKTRTKYLVQQIAGLQVYIAYLQKGYSIAKDGLSTISDIKNGEVNLHKDYFNSLKNVNPKIKRDEKVAAIMAFQAQINKCAQYTNQQVIASQAFNTAEQAYINRVLGRLREDCSKISKELSTLTTDGKLEMKDGERLQRISALYKEMQGNYIFSRHFSNEVLTLAAARMEAQKDIELSRLMNGIKKK